MTNHAFTSVTPAIYLECKRFESELPKLSEHDKAFIVGHKFVLETIRKGDNSWESGMLSRLIMRQAWLLAYRDHVERCIKRNEVPCTYNEWMVEQELKNEG